MSPRMCARVRKLVVLMPSFDLSPRRKLSTDCAEGCGDTAAQPLVSDACCAAERFASLNGTDVIVASFIVTIRRCVSQPLIAPFTAACASSCGAADQSGAFSGLPLT